ncbi:hypothetical protein LOAG_02881 [Loa loa]|uniref:Uncharacterized protein n=1 Tax=Loa loa TaxID=7209 RepID=A0A1S0U5K6_LOALO|nr:hypothetical protein LOAG_02881 [Loa loa]EFO25611.1 hypothetical protein LOAG_02881 [Loa loa]
MSMLFWRASVLLEKFLKRVTDLQTWVDFAGIFSLWVPTHNIECDSVLRCQWSKAPQNSTAAFSCEHFSTLFHTKIGQMWMSNSAATRPTSGGTGIRSFFSKLRKPSDLQIPPAQSPVRKVVLLIAKSF